MRPPRADVVNDPIAELYAGPWGRFVVRRAELVAAIRSSGDRIAAQTVASLRKPARGAWLVNLLVHREPARVAEAFALGEELARAHRDADAAELRRLSAARTAAITSLTQQAVVFGSEQDYAAPDSVRQEVSETLQAAMADHALATKVLAGTLVATVRAAGFGPADVFAPVLADVPSLRSSGRAARPGSEPQAPDPAEKYRLEREREWAEGRLEEARERLVRSRAAEERAGEELDRALTTRAALDERIAELERLLAETKAECGRADAQIGEGERRLAQRAANRESTEADAAGLLELIEELSRRLGD